MTGAGSLGLLFPPCLPLILYAIVAKVPIQSMFLGGILSGVVLLIATAGWGIIRQRPGGTDTELAFDWTLARRALWTAKWELLMPVVALGALFGGFATPVEAAALTALYALCIETLVSRGLKLTSDVPRVMRECGLLIGGVLLIQGVALGFTNYLVDAEITARAADWAISTIHSRWLFLLAVNLLLLVVGCLMEIYAAIVIQAPLLVTMGAAFGIDPVHLGIIFLANLELGYLTPPVGLNLLLSAFRFKKSVPEVLRAVTPLKSSTTIRIVCVASIRRALSTKRRWPISGKCWSSSKSLISVPFERTSWSSSRNRGTLHWPAPGPKNDWRSMSWRETRNRSQKLRFTVNTRHLESTTTRAS